MHIVTCGQASTLSEDERSRTLSSNATFGMMQALGVAPRPERVKKAGRGARVEGDLSGDEAFQARVHAN